MFHFFSNFYFVALSPRRAVQKSRRNMKIKMLTTLDRMTGMQGATPERVITPIKMAALQVSCKYNLKQVSSEMIGYQNAVSDSDGK